MTKTYKEKVEAVRSKLLEMTEDELLEHAKKVEDIYRTSRSGSKLGNFDWDTEYDYHWHAYDADADASLLQHRMSLGWGFATKEDAVKSGLAGDKLIDHTLDGETVVEMSHHSTKAVLLKIPKSIRKLNREIKERIRNNKPLVDSQGQSIAVTKTREGNKEVHYEREKPIEIG